MRLLMSISINSTSSVQTNHESAHAIKTAQLAKSQQEIEGQMALNLIQSAAPTSTGLSSNPNQIVDIKV